MFPPAASRRRATLRNAPLCLATQRSIAQRQPSSGGLRWATTIALRAASIRTASHRHALLRITPLCPVSRHNSTQRPLPSGLRIGRCGERWATTNHQPPTSASLRSTALRPALQLNSTGAQHQPPLTRRLMVGNHHRRASTQLCTEHRNTALHIAQPRSVTHRFASQRPFWREAMKIVEVDLVSTSPYSQSRMHGAEKREKETHDAYEKRTWREKCTADDQGNILIPAMAFKQALDTVAKRLGTQIPGKGKSTYTKHFVGGVICEADVAIPYTKDTVPGITINANSDGIRGSGKRVQRTFPQVPDWKGTARFAVLDDTVTPEIFEKHLTEAGRFIGIGRFRPEKGGLNGRFRPTAFRWSEV